MDSLYSLYINGGVHGGVYRILKIRLERRWQGTVAEQFEVSRCKIWVTWIQFWNSDTLKKSSTYYDLVQNHWNEIQIMICSNTHWGALVLFKGIYLMFIQTWVTFVGQGLGISLVWFLFFKVLPTNYLPNTEVFSSILLRAVIEFCKKFWWSKPYQRIMNSILIFGTRTSPATSQPELRGACFPYSDLLFGMGIKCVPMS